MATRTGTLADGMAAVRELVLDADGLVRAVAGGHRRGEQPQWRRVELRYVDLKAGRRLQVTRYDRTQAHVSNHAEPAAALDELLALPFGHWHVESTAATLQVRVTKSGGAQISRSAGSAAPADREHDRAKDRFLPEEHPVLRALGISDPQGRVKPNRRSKYRQVEAFLRELSAVVEEALADGRIAPTPADPLRVVDLGCGNAYLTFAAHAWLSQVRGLPVRVTGVDVKQQALDHNSEVARRLEIAEEVVFVRGGIDDVVLPEAPQVVLALHACDTATDDALARAIDWGAPVVLAAPCCHHDLSRQLRAAAPPEPYRALVGDGILRERFADTLTDAVRALLLRERGYRVDVVEFIGSQHTPRNTLIRARTGGRADPAAAEEYRTLVATWHLRPRLAELLDR